MCKKRDVLFIRLGVVLFILSVFTYRYYYHIMSQEAALVLAGLLMTGISYTLIRRLKTPRGGFTFEEQKEMNEGDVEKLLASKILHHAAEQDR